MSISSFITSSLTIAVFLTSLRPTLILVNIVLTFQSFSLRISLFSFCNLPSVKICSQAYQISPNFYTPKKNKQTVTEQHLIHWGLPNLRWVVAVQWSAKTPLIDKNDPRILALRLTVSCTYYR